MKLKEDVKVFLKKEESILINNNHLNSSTEQEITSGDGWSWWSSFLDCLLYYLPYPEKQCLQKLSSTLKDYYNGNPTELRNVNDFENQYKAEDTINWYTRETFIYRLLNKAFRQHNVTLLFLFGFFIQNIYKQLKHEYQRFKSEHSSSNFIKVYRGQSMWKDEIEQIKDGYNKIVNWCFLSTTYDRSLALIYLNDLVQPEDRVQNVLFEIEIDCRKISYPYADITHLSHFPNEREILFMTGSLFHVIDVVHDETQRAWLLKLELEEDKRKATEDETFLCLNNDASVRLFLKRAIRTLLQRLDSISVGDINIIFNRVFEIFPSEKNWLMAVRFHCLATHGECRYVEGPNKFQTRIDHYNKALEIWTTYMDDVELNCHLDIADIHREIAECYNHHSFKQSKKAAEHFGLALEGYKLALGNALIGIHDKIHIYENLDDIYEMNIAHSNLNRTDKVFEMALENRIDYVNHLLKCYRPDHVLLRGPLKKLAEFYEFAENYDQALINYEKALEIYKSQVPMDHQMIFMVATKIINIYTKYRNDHSSALRYQKLARDLQSQEEMKLGNFMTAAVRLKQSTTDSVVPN